uniref:Uncharacterized protein n=1 Tax=Meloidogyne hapla TaxID=6305 RepID=A0A1I8B6J7_MELHA
MNILQYTLIECRKRKLPWTGIKPKECQHMKETIPRTELLEVRSETAQTEESLFTTLAVSDEEDGSTVEYDDTIENMPPDKKIMNIESVKAKQKKGEAEKEMTTNPPENPKK